MGFRDPVINERFCLSHLINMGPKAANIGSDPDSIGFNLVDYGTHLLQCILVKSSFRNSSLMLPAMPLPTFVTRQELYILPQLYLYHSPLFPCSDLTYANCWAFFCVFVLER